MVYEPPSPIRGRAIRRRHGAITGMETGRIEYYSDSCARNCDLAYHGSYFLTRTDLRTHLC